MCLLQSLIALFLLGSPALGVPLSDEASDSSSNEIPSDVLNNLRKCSLDSGVTGILNCAAAKMLNSFETAEQQHEVELLPGVTLVSRGDQGRMAKVLKDDLLPAEPHERAEQLVDRLMNATARMIAQRTLKIQLPEAGGVARALEEGRGKMKKMMGPLMLGLGAKMITIVPIMLGGLALLASKALLIGKLAFVISIILFVQYFFSGKNILPPFNGYGGYGNYGYGNTYGGTYGGYGTNTLGGGGGGGWGTAAQYPYARSLDTPENVQDSKTVQELVYSGHT